MNIIFKQQKLLKQTVKTNRNFNTLCRRMNTVSSRFRRTHLLLWHHSAVLYFSLELSGILLLCLLYLGIGTWGTRRTCVCCRSVRPICWCSVSVCLPRWWNSTAKMCGTLAKHCVSIYKFYRCTPTISERGYGLTVVIRKQSTKQIVTTFIVLNSLM